MRNHEEPKGNEQETLYFSSCYISKQFQEIIFSIMRVEFVDQLCEREPYGYREFSDNREHVVSQGETLFSLAAHYLGSLPRGAGLWWVIADFQPDPIHDPTIKLSPGSTLIIPSVRTVLEAVFDETRRLEVGV